MCASLVPITLYEVLRAESYQTFVAVSRDLTAVSRAVGF
jgi:hypothetical protein